MNIDPQFKDLRMEFPPFGKCMYCHSKAELTREHIVPYGLNGPGVLPQSSCGECAKITSKFEREVLRGNFWGLRAYLRFSSRRKSKMPRSLPITLMKGEEQFEVHIPITEHPIFLSFPIFGIPAIAGGAKVRGIYLNGLLLFNFGEPKERVLKKHGANDFQVQERSKPISFARLLAKIAWGVAIINGLEKRLDFGLRDAFMYNPDEIGEWVGTYTGSLSMTKNMLHEVRIREDHQLGLLMADVKLFANSETPKYGVILGKI